jgi:hypothetical protein
LADELRERVWAVSVFPMPLNGGDLVVQRIVVKEDFNRELGERPLADLRKALEYLELQTGHQRKEEGSHFHH